MREEVETVRVEVAIVREEVAMTESAPWLDNADHAVNWKNLILSPLSTVEAEALDQVEGEVD